VFGARFDLRLDDQLLMLSEVLQFLRVHHPRLALDHGQALGAAVVVANHIGPGHTRGQGPYDADPTHVADDTRLSIL
jgi:hypothetical protein